MLKEELSGPERARISKEGGKGFGALLVPGAAVAQARLQHLVPRSEVSQHRFLAGAVPQGGLAPAAVLALLRFQLAMPGFEAGTL